MNKVIRAFALEDKVRILAVDTSSLVEQTRKMHKLYPTSAAALGRTLSVASILGSLLTDDKEKIRVEIRGDGPLGHIFVDADAKGNVRGLVGNPQILMMNEDNGKLDVGGAVGAGMLKVVRLVEGRDPFVSTVPLISGEIGDDFAYYFAQSEQVPSALSVGVSIDEDYRVLSSGALLFQALPEASEEDIQKLEETIQNLAPVSELVKRQGIEEIVQSLFDDVRILETSEVHYACSCNQEKMLRALSSLGKDDLQTLIEDGEAELVCHYCQTHYHFDKSALQVIYDGQDKA